MTDKVTKDWNLHRIFEEFGDDGLEIMIKYDICLDCFISRGLKLDAVAYTRNIDLNALLEDLNKIAEKKKKLRKNISLPIFYFSNYKLLKLKKEGTFRNFLFV